jgi:hypothetical protein
MKSVVHFFGKLPKTFFTHTSASVWAKQYTKTHNGTRKGSAGAASLSHAAAEPCTKLFGLFGRQSSIKTMVKHKQERLGAAQLVVFVKVFSPLADKFNYFVALERTVRIFKSHLRVKRTSLFLRGRIIIF